MSKAIVSLGKHSAVYAIGSAISAAGNFLLIPLVTHALSTTDYGGLELLNRIGDMLILVVFLGCRQAYIRFYYDKKDNEEWQKKVTATMFVFVVLSGITVCFAAYCIQELVLKGFVGSNPVEMSYKLLLAWVPMEMIYNVGLAFLQVRSKPTLFVLMSATKLCIFIALSWLLVYPLHQGIVGIFIAQLIATSLLSTGFAVFFVKWTKLKGSIVTMKELIHFGLPLLPATILVYIMTNVDRYILSSSQSLAALGVYSLAYKLGMFGSSMIVGPFLNAWSPFLFANYSTPEGKVEIGRAFMLFVLLSSMTAVIISVLAPVVIPLLAPIEYSTATGLVPAICLAAFFYGTHHLADAGLQISKKTFYKPIIFGIACFISVIANFILIPVLSYTGAAISCVLSNFTLLFATFYFSWKFYRFDIQYKRIAILGTCCVFIYGVSVMLTKVFGANYALASSMLSLIAFPFLLWVTGVISPKDSYTLLRLMRREA